MTAGETVADRIREGCHSLRNDGLGALPEGICRVAVVHVGHTAHHQPGQLLEPTRQVQVHHHAVHVVEQLVEVFQEQDLAPRIDIVRCAAQGVEQGEVAADDDAFAGAFPRSGE